MYKIDESFGKSGHEKDLVLVSTDRTALTSEKTTWNGLDAHVVRFKEPADEPTRKFAVWIVPSMDYSVVRADFEAGKYSGSVKCEMDRHGKPGVWFPKVCVTE